MAVFVLSGMYSFGVNSMVPWGIGLTVGLVLYLVLILPLLLYNRMVDLICMIAGHKKTGCVCQRCGEAEHAWDNCECRRCGTVSMAYYHRDDCSRRYGAVEHDRDSECRCGSASMVESTCVDERNCIDDYSIGHTEYWCRRCGAVWTTPP